MGNLHELAGCNERGLGVSDIVHVLCYERCET